MRANPLITPLDQCMNCGTKLNPGFSVCPACKIDHISDAGRRRVLIHSEAQRLGMSIDDYWNKLVDDRKEQEEIESFKANEKKQTINKLMVGVAIIAIIILIYLLK